MHRSKTIFALSVLAAFAGCGRDLPTSPAAPAVEEVAALAETTSSGTETLLGSTDFASYSAGIRPSDWTERWNTGSSDWTVRRSSDGSSLLEHRATQSKRNAISWNKLGTLSDVRLHTRVRMLNVSGGGLAGLIVGGSGAAGGEAGYLWRFKNTGDFRGVELARFVGGSARILKSYPFSFGTGAAYHMVLERSGSTVRAKVWKDGASEPSGWQVSVTDSNVGSGWAGFSNWKAGTYRYDFLRGYKPAASATQEPIRSSSIDTIFYEGFESGSLAVFDDGVDDRHKVITNSSLAVSGSRLLQITYPPGKHGGWLTRFFMPGYDSLYVRYYVRAGDSWQGDTKLLSVRGSRIDDKWSAFGGAGNCPDGYHGFSTGVVSGAPERGGNINFYTYYPEMRREADGKCWGRWGDGTESYTSPRQLTPGRWQKVEFWIKLNTPGQKNAVQKFWIDGQLRGAWSGISLRKTSDLRLNSVMISSSAKTISTTRYLYVDDLLVTTAPPGR